MTAKYEALEREKQEILRCIEEDRKAEEAYLVSRFDTRNCSRRILINIESAEGARG